MSDNSNVRLEKLQALKQDYQFGSQMLNAMIENGNESMENFENILGQVNEELNDMMKYQARHEQCMDKVQEGINDIANRDMNNLTSKVLTHSFDKKRHAQLMAKCKGILTAINSRIDAMENEYFTIQEQTSLLINDMVSLQDKLEQLRLEKAEKKRQMELEAEKKRQMEWEKAEQKRQLELEEAERKRQVELEAAEKKRQLELEAAEKKRRMEQEAEMKRQMEMKEAERKRQFELEEEAEMSKRRKYQEKEGRKVTGLNPKRAPVVTHHSAKKRRVKREETPPSMQKMPTIIHKTPKKIPMTPQKPPNMNKTMETDYDDDSFWDDD